MKKQDIHLEILALAVSNLKPVLNEIVFLGGSVISLFVDELSGRDKSGDFYSVETVSDSNILLHHQHCENT